VLHLILAAALGAAPWPGASGPAAAVASPQSRSAAPAGAQPTRKAADPLAEAYYQFVLGRRLEEESDVDGAIAAFTRAMTLDPASADLPTELAELYARQSRVREAIAAAEAAIKINPGHSGAHRILGSIYATLAERDERGAGADPAATTYQRQAITHLEQSLTGARPDVAVGVRLALARLYMQGASTDKAIGVLKQLLADEPWLPQGVALLAQAYTSAGRNTDAVALLKDAATMEPSFYEVLAEAYEKDKQWAEAADAYEQASRQSPNDVDVKTRWASALLNVPGDATARQARDLLLGITKANSTAGWPLYLLARAQRALGDLDASEASARRLMSISPGSTSGAHALAQVLEARRAWPAIIEALEPVAARNVSGRGADTALILTHLGFAYLEVGREADAIAAFDRATRLDPDDTSLKTYLAQALVTAKEYDRALVLARAGRATDPADARLARLEADALRGLGRFDEGVAVLKQLADTAPGDVLATQALAEYYAAARRYADAAALLKSGQARFPNDMNLLFQYGAMLERQEQHGEAERIFRQIIAKDPEHAPTLNYLGYILAEQGSRLDEAVSLIKRAVALDPHNGAYLDSLGWAFVKLNQLDLAGPNLRLAAEQLPRDSVVQDHWGDFLAKKGRYPEAIDAWRRSLAGDGEQIERAQIERKIREALNRFAKD
jgi:tetratricopeptide (TPR) repeat protein